MSFGAGIGTSYQHSQGQKDLRPVLDPVTDLVTLVPNGFGTQLEDNLGSAYEWETQLIVCYRQKFIKEGLFLKLEDQVVKIQSKISNFMDTLDPKN